MNSIIRELQKSKLKQEEKVKMCEYELAVVKKGLIEEIHKETELLNKVLKYNMIEIINYIHKRGLKCSSIQNAETIWHDTVYRVSDDFYFADIIAKDGEIAMDLTHINNGGAGTGLYKIVKNLIDYDISPFCEKEKVKYID